MFLCLCRPTTSTGPSLKAHVCLAVCSLYSAFVTRGWVQLFLFWRGSWTCHRRFSKPNENVRICRLDTIICNHVYSADTTNQTGFHAPLITHTQWHAGHGWLETVQSAGSTTQRVVYVGIFAAGHVERGQCVIRNKLRKSLTRFERRNLCHLWVVSNCHCANICRRIGECYDPHWWYRLTDIDIIFDYVVLRLW